MNILVPCRVIGEIQAMLIEDLLLHYREPEQALAVAYLSAPDAFPGLPPSQGQIVLRLFCFPAFEAYSSWALFEKEGSYRVRRIEWDHGMKLAKLPGTYGAEAELDASTAASLVSELKAMSVPLHGIRRMLGLDGVSFAVSIGDHWNAVQFSWWCEPPEGFGELAAWYERALAVFEEALPVSTLRNPQFQYRHGA